MAATESPKEATVAQSTEKVSFFNQTDVLTETLDKFRDENLLEGSEIFSNKSVEIGKTDALIVVDMQNDFLPSREEFDKHGSLGVLEGDLTIQPICDMIDKFKASGATVCATRDYHPEKHCSFLDDGGWFPPHCVYQTDGILISEQISNTLSKYDDINIFSKGFLYGFDSFGGFPYANGSEEGRICKTKDCSSTGGAVTFKDHIAKVHARACLKPPSEFKDNGEAEGSITLAAYLKERGIKRIFCVGLVLEFCVLDTAVNGADAGFEVHMLLDCTRALVDQETKSQNFDPKKLEAVMKDKVVMRSLFSLDFAPPVPESSNESNGAKREVVPEESGEVKRQRIVRCQSGKSGEEESEVPKEKVS